MRILLVLALVACRTGGGDGPPCSAVGGSFFTIARGELEHAQVDDQIRRAVTEQLPAMRDALAQLCTDGAWVRAARECMVHAADHAGLQACEAQLTADQRAALDQNEARPFDEAQRHTRTDAAHP